MDSRSDAMFPLTPLSNAILLALVDRDLHGYALIQEISRQTSRALEPGTGTLYAALQRIKSQGWIADSELLPAPDEDQRRKYYHLTEAGRDVLQAELRRLARVLEIAAETSMSPGLAQGT